MDIKRSFLLCQAESHSGITVCLYVHLLIGIWLFLVWGLFMNSAAVDMYTGVYMDIGFHFLQVNTQE